jgi:hypothetical protein
VHYTGTQVDGHGLLCNISSTGARISEATTSVPVGAKLRLEFGSLSGLPPIPMQSEVVRLTEDGFAVQFVEEEADRQALLRRLLEMAREE